MTHDGSQEQSSVQQSSMGLGDGNSQEPQPESGGQSQKFQEISLLSGHPSRVPTAAK